MAEPAKKIEEETESFACDLCPKVLSSAGGLGLHQRRVHGIAGKRTKRPPKAKGPELPVLGEPVQVTLLALDPATGEVTIGLNGKWRAVLR